ncbi:MAG: DNA polymerase III subunit epsilon [Holosporales bacterium]|jgi:DNA polymerase-3 subunit epsilon|nr:DNA polymerase III subunit epsilon [Holosporales bacterium]
MQREVVLDTETTGLDPCSGHRVIEIGGIELINHIPTGREYQAYINPKRDVPAEATNISGITTEFLVDKPLFADVVGDFLSFISDSNLVIHNAAFDIKFLNFELNLVEKPLISQSRAVDTLFMARQKFPGSPASLDALCNRFNIDASVRVKHGAVIDCKLLAEVYLNLIGGRQTKFTFLNEGKSASQEHVKFERKFTAPRPHFPTEEEIKIHRKFLEKIESPVWHDYIK